MSIRSMTLLCISLTFVAVVSCCGAPTERSIVYNKYATLAKPFFKMPVNEQLVKFTDYDLETQYGIFIFGNQVVHPPAIYLAGPFARQGKVVVDFLREKLSHAHDDLIICDIVFVLSEVSKRRTYDVIGDKNLMALINVKVAEIKDTDWRKMSEQRVVDIQEGKRFPRDLN